MLVFLCNECTQAEMLRTRKVCLKKVDACVYICKYINEDTCLYIYICVFAAMNNTIQFTASQSALEFAKQLVQTAEHGLKFLNRFRIFLVLVCLSSTDFIRAS